MRKTKELLVLGLAAAAVVVGCHKPKTYETTVEIMRVSTVRKDEQGHPLSMDVEISYAECPGMQTEVFRGGKEFAECLHGKVKVGDKVKVTVQHSWDPEGYYDYDVLEMAGCKRQPDPNDEASYKVVRECSDWVVNGTRVGFQCDYGNRKELSKKCPWFAKN